MAISNNLLVYKLDDFIRKYYKNRMLKGLIFVASWFLISYLSVNVLEYFGNFDTGVRTFLFFTFILGNLSIIGYYVVIPILKMFRIGKVLSYKQAALIVGEHFGEIKDKLLNTLQLQEQMQSSSNDVLMAASIEQRIQQLSPVSFTKVINFNENKKYLKYAALPLLLLLGILLINSNIITGSTQRLIRYNQYFEPVAPFALKIKNESLEVVQSQDLDLLVEVEGDQLPNEVYIVWNNNRYKLDKFGKSEFGYSFKNIQSNIDFSFSAEEYRLGNYEITVLPNPVISNFEVELDYPAYTGRADEILNNVGDLIIPYGTQVKWIFDSKNSDEVVMDFENERNEVKRISAGKFSLLKRIVKNSAYSVLSYNKLVDKPDSISFNITVIPDLFPEISASETPDSLNAKLIYFSGEINDDYGFSNLTFNVVRSMEDGKKAVTSKALGFTRGSLRQSFFHFFNFSEFGLKPGEALEYYFEVTDNDQVSGGKKMRSSIFEFRVPTIEEMEKTQNQNSEQVKSSIKESIKDLKQIQEEIEQMKDKLLEKKELDWKDKKKLENLIKKEQQIEEQLREASQKNRENIEQSEEFNPSTERILQKKQDLQEMFDKVLSEDIKKNIEEIQKMLDKVEKDKLDELKLDNKEVEKELDRMMEFYKELEVEEKLEKAVKDLEKLSKEQEKLSEETKSDKDKTTEESKKDQEKLSKEFEKLEKDLKDIEKKNEELERPKDIGGLDKEADEVKEKQDEAMKELDKDSDKKEDEKKSQDADNQKDSDKKDNKKPSSQEKKKASDKQKDAADKMKKMAEKMKEQMQKSEKEELEEDMLALRMLLENLIKLSFGQEKLIDRLKENSNYSQVYVEIAQDQFKIKDDAKVVEDSLFALSKRVIQLQSVVNKEMGLINLNLDKSIEHLGKRETPQAKMRQQYVMTSMNNLALMLTEILNSMQQEMSGMMQGDQNCNKPGSGKGQGSGSGKGKSKSESLKKMSELQKAINEQLKKMGESKNSGGKKPGGDQQGGSGGGGSGSASEFAKMVAKQEAIRRELQKLSDEFKQEGIPQPGNLGELQKLMDDTEKDLLNKNIKPETLKRQQDILTRLLESEKAEREREFDNQRKSTTADEILRVSPPGFEQYKQQKLRELELYKSVSPELNNFYKQKVEEYFLNLNK